MTTPARTRDLTRNATVAAIKKGVLVRPSKCEECGVEPAPFPSGRAAVEGHHPDYNDPLRVMWLCRPCHRKWHRFQSPVPLEGEDTRVPLKITITNRKASEEIRQAVRSFGFRSRSEMRQCIEYVLLGFARSYEIRSFFWKHFTVGMSVTPPSEES